MIWINIDKSNVKEWFLNQAQFELVKLIAEELNAQEIEGMTLTQEKINKKYETMSKNAKNYKDVVSGRKESAELVNLRKRKVAK